MRFQNNKQSSHLPVSQQQDGLLCVARKAQSAFALGIDNVSPSFNTKPVASQAGGGAQQQRRQTQLLQKSRACHTKPVPS